MEVTMKTMKSSLFTVSIFLLVVQGYCGIQEIENQFIQVFTARGTTNWTWYVTRSKKLLELQKTTCTDACTALNLNNNNPYVETISVSARKYPVIFKHASHNPMCIDLVYCTVAYGNGKQAKFYMSEGGYVLQSEDPNKDSSPVHIIGVGETGSSASKRKRDVNDNAGRDNMDVDDEDEIIFPPEC